VPQSPGPLEGLRVLDLSRILAGPSCTQMLGDLGAEIIKVERPGAGDDTRRWGPPFLADRHGRPSPESAYFLSANRNKRSVTIDLAQAEGQRLARRLLERCDILVENFKVGGLACWGLGYDDLKERRPDLIYCSISGFGQTGPEAARPGYDLMAQARGGVMSITGQPDGPPTKVGVAVADIVCGLYAACAILAALRHRERSGAGQHIDLGLLDTQVAWLANQGLGYLLTGEVPRRAGNTHPHIVPYEVFATTDGELVLAAGNDEQFRRFCAVAGKPALALDPRYATNAGRVEHRDTLVPELQALIATRSSAEWLRMLDAAGVPCGPVQNIAQVFEDPQVQHRGMRVDLPDPHHPDREIPQIANPIRLSETPVRYRSRPPKLGEHTGETLTELAGLSPAEIAELRGRGVI